MSSAIPLRSFPLPKLQLIALQEKNVHVTGPTTGGVIATAMGSR
jgi:hypothetical protein